MDLKIDFTPGAQLPFKRPYAVGGKELEVVKKYLEDEGAKGFICQPTSSIASPMIVVDKPGRGAHLCVDFRAVNAIAQKNRSPVPQITEALASFGNVMMFTVLDIISAFNMIRIAVGDEWKTACTTRYGTYEYLVVPFGLCIARSAFQATSTADCSKCLTMVRPHTLTA